MMEAEYMAREEEEALYSMWFYHFLCAVGGTIPAR
jgi:hypothetical protein